MTATFRTLLVTANPASSALLARLTEGTDIAVYDVVTLDKVIASVAHRPPDLIVIDAESDMQELTQVCAVLKTNPATVLLPLLAIAKSSKSRLAAFDAGVDEFLTQQVRREEFFVRARALLRAKRTPPRSRAGKRPSSGCR